jgi:hypothetical protein
MGTPIHDVAVAHAYLSFSPVNQSIHQTQHFNVPSASSFYSVKVKTKSSDERHGQDARCAVFLRWRSM